MKNNNGIREVLSEMVIEAAKEINFIYDEGCSELIETRLWVNYDIKLNDDAPVTWQIMNIISNEIREWQQETKENYM